MALKLADILSKFPNSDAFNKMFDANDKLLTIAFSRQLQKVIKCVFDNIEMDGKSVQVDVIYDISWEHINTGLFKDASSTWRKVYGISCLMLAYLLLQNIADSEDLKRCLYLCDMSLMMGGELFHDGDIFTALIATDIHSLLVADLDISSKEDDILITDLDFDPLKYIPHNIIENVKPLPRIDCPSVEDFLKLLKTGNPCILTNVISSWPCLSTRKWSVSYIKSLCGHRTVPIEIGSHYADDNWTQRLMTVAHFIDEFFYDSSSTMKGYLAQHYLFSQIAELAEDIDIPDYCYSDIDGEPTDIDINGWFGPAGTVSPLHQDPKPNLLCQVFGSKYVKLYSATESQYLYPNSTTMLKNTSKIDVINPNIDEFPDYINARGFDGFINAGEVLFIPPKCWHYVRSLSSSFSVNFWWSNKI